MGHAFAHYLDRRTVIPRDPELRGALGVALLALQRFGSADPAEAFAAANSNSHSPALLDLAAPEIKTVGWFTCGACQMACSINRLEVAGRRSPFGGRCSLYDNVWKRKSRTAPAPDLVEQRNRLLFGFAGNQQADREGYNGIIVIGPFNCLPYRISEAILKPLSLQRGTPILTYESDGYAVSPSFLRQVDVHIQQVLGHVRRTRQGEGQYPSVSL